MVLDFPKTEEEWVNVPKTSVDIRRGFVVLDILKQARKSRFDETKLLTIRELL